MVTPQKGALVRFFRHLNVVTFLMEGAYIYIYIFFLYCNFFLLQLLEWSDVRGDTERPRKGTIKASTEHEVAQICFEEVRFWYEADVKQIQAIGKVQWSS